MAIEGPLRELGIHDVFQLLDLSRKTGLLRVSSQLREDEGVVFFDNGCVVQAAIRSKMILLQAGRVTEVDIERARAAQQNGHAGRDIVDLLVEDGALTMRELDRQLRLQLESVVFELMSWREGFFSFEERERNELPRDSRISVSTESLLMEGARRIDEWSRIADLIPDVTVIPELAPVDSERNGGMLDLLPHEWQVLTMIDGDRDLRAIATALSRDEFETAKIAYGLATTGIISVHPAPPPPTAQPQPLSPRAHLDLAFAAARHGDLVSARAGWEAFLRLAPGDPAVSRVREALDATMRLQRAIEAHTNA